MHMKEYGMKMKEAWANLATREKQAVTLGGALLGFFIVYQWIWTPYLDGVDSMRKRIRSDQETLSWMRAADHEIQNIEAQSKGKASADSPVALLSQIQKQVQAAGLDKFLTQLKQATNKSIEMHFQKIEFEKLMGLLVSVLKQQNIAITQMTVTALNNSPGTVNADIVMSLAT